MNKIQRKSLILLFLFFICHSYIIHAGFEKFKIERNTRLVKNVYRVYTENKNGKEVWIVDGLIIRGKIFDEFLYGGNSERYPFIPQNEIWIDNAISAEEYKYTLAHELNERNLMAKKGMSYADAHDSSLALEHNLRLNDKESSNKHEDSLTRVSPTDCDSVKEIAALPDSVQLRNIYRQFICIKCGISIWIVDGSVVRRDIFPDFGLSGNDLAYHFIPKNEIWIDAQISCEETEFSITSELKERELMAMGMSYDGAYTVALHDVTKQRNELSKISYRHKPVILPNNLTRDMGTGSEK
jgi:hypothetical protein